MRVRNSMQLCTRGSPQIRIGKAAIERHAQFAFACSGNIAVPRARTHGVERTAIGPHHVEDVIGILHAPLNLEGRNTCLHKLAHMIDRAVVARTQQALPLLHVNGAPLSILQIVGKATRLRTVSAVCRAPPSQGGRRARPRIADADGSVAKNLDGHANGAYARNLRQGELARNRDALDPQVLTHIFDTRRRHDPRLGGEMNLGA